MESVHSFIPKPCGQESLTLLDQNFLSACTIMYIITLGGHSVIKGKIRPQTWFSTLSMYIVCIYLMNV